jgi:hypothetical protein
MLNKQDAAYKLQLASGPLLNRYWAFYGVLVNILMSFMTFSETQEWPSHTIIQIRKQK